MNVWHIIDSEGLYGAELMLLQLAEQQLKKGINATIVSIGNHHITEKAIETEAMKRNIPLRVFRMKDGPNFIGAYRVIRAAQQDNVNIFHSHGYKGNIIFGLIPKFIRKTPIISTLHGWIVGEKFSRMAVYVWMDKLSIRNMDYVVTVNQRMQEFLPEKIKNKGKVMTIENGIASEVNKAGITDAGDLMKKLPQTRYTIGSIGRLSEEKGFKDLIAALEMLRNNDVDVRLIIIGDGPERDTLEQEAKQRGVSEYVVLPGYQSSIDSYLSIYDIMLLPSLTEGLPLTLLEAMRSRTPVIATGVGGMPIVIEDGRGGIIINKESPQEICQAITRLLDDKELAASYADFSYKKFCKNYTVKTMERKYSRVYEALLQSVLEQ